MPKQRSAGHADPADLCVMWWFVVRCLLCFVLCVFWSGAVRYVLYGAVRHAMVWNVCTCVGMCWYGSDRNGGETESCSHSSCRT